MSMVQRAKWEQYYAVDPRSAPWDTHAVSSQLQAFLCCCPVAAAGGAEHHASNCLGVSHYQRWHAGTGAALVKDGCKGRKAEEQNSALHVCAACFHLRPWFLPAHSDIPQGGRASGGPQSLTGDSPRALELCCGTGSSLAFLCSMGFSVVGVELVVSACELAASRLAEVAGAPVPIVRIADIDVASADVATVSNDNITAGAVMTKARRAVIMHGDLFAAALPPASFEFAYDCQGLHAMPPQLRPAYVGVLHSALRPGGLALVLVGRVEEDAEVETVGGKAEQGLGQSTPKTDPQPESVHTAESSGSGQGGGQAGRAGCGTGDVGGADDAGPRATTDAATRGPSLMSRAELRELFAETDWQVVWCKPSRFDLTPAYAAMPRPPPAWCMLLRKR